MIDHSKVFFSEFNSIFLLIVLCMHNLQFYLQLSLINCLCAYYRINVLSCELMFIHNTISKSQPAIIRRNNFYSMNGRIQWRGCSLKAYFLTKYSTEGEWMIPYRLNRKLSCWQRLSKVRRTCKYVEDFEAAVFTHNYLNPCICHIHQGKSLIATM